MRGRNTARTDLASQNSSFVYNGIPCGYITNPKTRPTLTMKNTLIKRFSNILLLAGLSTIAPLHAQELSNIGKEPLLDISGGASLNQVFFHSGDTLSQRQPYAYTLMANMNVSVYGWAIPLSVVYSNQNWSYTQPFNQFTLHPSYKWIQLHVGHVSMNFSPYTLSGHQFLGGGAELAPPESPWKFSAMSGRMQKRILPDTSGQFDPAYQRFGSGLKAEYATAFGTFGVSSFYARDDENSLPGIIDSTGVTPQENLALGINSNVSFLEHFTLALDYGTSTHTENTRGADGMQHLFMPMIPVKESTRQYHAVKSNLSYNSPFGQIGVGYERIDPGYKTLGAYYNTNDFENYTLNYAGGILQNKVTLAASAGLQTDDLNNQKDQKTSRRVGNFNLGFAPNQKFGANMMYSNFQNYTNIKTGFEDINTNNPYGHLDTLDFTQISESFNLTLTYRLGSGEKMMHNINVNGGWQEASQQQTDNPHHALTTFYTAMGGYTLSHKNTGLTTSIMANYSRSGADTLLNEMAGPSLSVRKAFLDKKLRTSLTYSYNVSQLNHHWQSDNNIVRANVSYSLQEHALNLTGMLAQRSKAGAPRRGPDMTVTLTYSYNFGWTPGKKNDEPTNTPAP